MKKSLLITVSLLTFGVITGIYAAEVIGASVVDKMKAVAHSFTLGSILNPTDTGLTSDPVKGKKTGDILTAGEYNRLLELLSEGGVGSSGGGSGWVDVPLTDTNPFDHNGCQYRVKITGPAYNAGAGFSADGYYSSDYVTTGILELDSGIFIKSGTKNIVYVMDQSNGAIVEVTTAWGWRPTKIEKLCGGGGGASSSGGGVEIVDGGIITTTATSTEKNLGSNWDLISLTGSYNSGDAGATGGYIYKLGGQKKMSIVEATGLNKDAVLTTTEQCVYNLCVKLSGDNVIIKPSNNTVAYLVWKFTGGSGSSPSSSWVDVSLTDTADFNTSCEYRMKMNNVASAPGFAATGDYWYYATAVGAKSIIYVAHTSQVTHVNSDSKNSFRLNGASTYTVLKMEKRCN